MTDLRSRIIQCNTKPIEHTNPELGTVYIRRMTLGELNTLQEENEKAKTDKLVLPLSTRLLSRFVGDEQGQKLFDLTKPDDVAVIAGMPVAVVADLLRAGNKVNNINAEDVQGKA